VKISDFGFAVKLKEEETLRGNGVINLVTAPSNVGRPSKVAK